MRRGSALLVAVALAGGTALPAQSARSSGIDLDAIDRSVRPQDDFYRFANGRWLQTAVMPDDHVSYGVFAMFGDAVEQDLQELILDLVRSGPYKPGTPEQQIADFYTSAMDEEGVDDLGSAPLLPVLARIEAIDSIQAFAAETGALSAAGFGGPFAGAISQDAEDPTRLVARLEQGGTLLPDREYYLSGVEPFPTIRAKYVEYLETMFRLVGRPNAAEDARAVLLLEREIGRARVPEEETRNPAGAFHPYKLGQLATAMPGFDWVAWARPQGLDRVAVVSLAQPTFFRRFAALVPSRPLETWKAWLTARYLTAAAPYVSSPFQDARFEFFGRTLTDQAQPRARWRCAVDLVNLYLGEAVGQLYVQRHFSPAARSRALALVQRLVSTARDVLRRNKWLSSGAKGVAFDKLDQLSIKIGYPDEWESYRGLVIRPDDLMGNVMRAKRFGEAERLTRVRRAVERGRWLVTPQTVNAYYSPAMNEIVVPAAMLQPPLFSLDADPAVNYGAIGSIIGHELIHSFDAAGRLYDEAGNPRDWWSAKDEQAFTQRAGALADQYDAYVALPNLSVNGRLTAAENIGDLAGLRLALAAYERSLGGKPAPVLDGFTGTQRVFLGWAQSWRSILRDGFLRQWVISSPHAPPLFRANGPLGNIDAFYEAFDVKPGDGLYRAPEDRVRIW